MGTLVNPEDPMGRVFIQRIQARTPHYTRETLLEEAYKFLGGEISKSETKSPTQDINHLHTATRARASVPGQAAPAASHTAKRFERLEDAIAASLRTNGVI